LLLFCLCTPTIKYFKNNNNNNNNNNNKLKNLQKNPLKETKKIKKNQIRSLRFFCRFLNFEFLFCFFIFVNLREGEKNLKKQIQKKKKKANTSGQTDG
jgi:hypothetical protein